jgi:predicted transcriptional regulator
MTAKELVIHALKKLPEETSIEEILEEIEILAAIQQGEDAADAGRVTPHEEVKNMVASWTSK